MTNKATLDLHIISGIRMRLQILVVLRLPTVTNLWMHDVRKQTHNHINNMNIVWKLGIIKFRYTEKLNGN